VNLRLGKRERCKKWELIARVALDPSEIEEVSLGRPETCNKLILEIVKLAAWQAGLWDGGAGEYS